MEVGILASDKVIIKYLFVWRYFVMKMTKLNIPCQYNGYTEIVGFKSPITVEGQRILPVVLWSFVQKKSFLINIPWERVATVCIGYTYNCGYFMEKPFSEYGTIFVDKITGMEIVRADSLSISWRPDNKQIYPEIADEYFVKFVHLGRDYIVSCIEIVRALLAPSTVIANQLLTSDGFYSMIKDYQIDGDKTELTIENKYCRVTKNETLINWILNHDELQKLVEETYVSSVCGKLKVHIPIVHGLALLYDGYRKGE